MSASDFDGKPCVSVDVERGMGSDGNGDGVPCIQLTAWTGPGRATQVTLPVDVATQMAREILEAQA